MYDHQKLESYYLGSIDHPPESTDNLKVTSMTMAVQPALLSGVLIVEDFDAIRALLSRHLEARGYEVFSAGTVGHALAVTREVAPCALIIDYDLGRDEAYGAISSLHSLSPDCYIVLMGGPGTPEVKEKALHAGASRVLPKGYELAEMDAVLSEAANCGRGSKNVL